MNNQTIGYYLKHKRKIEVEDVEKTEIKLKVLSLKINAQHTEPGCLDIFQE